MASTWGGTSIPAPTRYDRQATLVGTQYIVSDGSMVTDSVTAKTVVDLEFGDVTSSERDTLITKFTTFASAALVIESETSENVIPVANSLNVSRVPGGKRVYVVSGQVRTA